MRIPKMIDSLVQYFSDAIARIFGPSDDAYPDVGVQPFEGDPYSEWVENRKS